MSTIATSVSGWRSGLLFPMAVALVTLGLGGGVQFLMWGGAVSANLEQLDRRLASLDERLEDVFPRAEALAFNAGMRQSIEAVSVDVAWLARRVAELEQAVIVR